MRNCLMEVLHDVEEGGDSNALVMGQQEQVGEVGGRGVGARPALQKIYEAYFSDNSLDGILFPTTVAPAPAIDAEKGSGEMSINGDKPVPTFDTMIRNTDPGSNAGIPGLSLFAGMTPGGLPVGLEIDGPVGSDAKLLGLGLSIEGILGSAPPPKA